MVADAKEVSKVIRGTTIFTAIVGVVLSPIPLADELVFLPTYGVMTARLARKHGLPMRSVPWKTVMTTAVAGLAARGAVDLTVAYIPGVASVANCVSAIALTQFLGRYVDGVCNDPASARTFSVKEILGTLRKNRDAKPKE
jgi:uncharacterized protein (DUF697 family)